DPQSSEQAGQQQLGLAVQPLTPTIAQQLGVPATTRGVVIAGVDASTDAGQKGLRRGDVVLTANGAPITTEAELNAAVTAAKKAGRNAILLQVLRRGQPAAFVPIRLRGN
ncbi:MAG: PDZ domain-containing protein, partial [Sphingobium sp.]